MSKKIERKYLRKHVDFFRLIEKIKLWPSRRGILHGVKYFEMKSIYGYVTTHCNKKFMIRPSRRSRAARWLRNKWYREACRECNVPEWKIKKYSLTFFDRHRGSLLRKE